jgi:nicotinamide mononucleotide adenylyltransferase
MRFKEYLTEKEEKHAVMAFGRMNPITNGHQKLVDTVKNLANKFNAYHNIVLSHSQDSKKNPLSAQQKIKHAKRAFPGVNFSASDHTAPNFLSQAAKLFQSGITHLHMVGGSDRVKEFMTTLKKYNGTHVGALFNFKKIHVHSAGERDPDAEGTTGISASKMRDHAINGNFAEFRKGAPTTMSDAHVKQMYNDVRKGMSVKESIDQEFQELLSEGVHDKGIFKAVFLAGGPGSGKDYVLSNTLDGHGLVEINSDKALEFLMDKKGLDKTMPAAEKASRDQIRGRAKDITELKQKLALKGRNGLIVNGTGDDVEKISRIKNKLEEIGYETSMLMVNTSDEVSAARNIERGQRGGRTVPETIRKEKWDAAQNGRTEYAKMFGANYMEFDNSEDLRNADPDTVKSKKMEMMELFKNVQDFIAKPPKNPAAEEWVAAELEKKDTYRVPKNGVEQVPPSDDGASAEARKMGLKYYGFGRYGINNEVTHRSVHGKLVPVKKEEPEQKKKVKKESIDGEFENLIAENFDLSDSSALNLLLLGTEIDEHDLPMGEEKEQKLLKDKAGRVRIFMLRAAAAREAHTHNGLVLKYKNGYVIQLKENENVNETNSKVLWEFRREGRETPIGWSSQSSNGEGQQVFRSSSQYSGGTQDQQEGSTFLSEQSDYRLSNTITEEKTIQETRTTKITLAEIRAKKEKLQEETLSEIDKGIEPGISMAASGENMSRGTLKVKQIKKPLEELTGDETTASISAQVEDGLKKKGMDLKTFRSKRPIG